MKSFRKTLWLFLALALLSSGVAWGNKPFDILDFFPAILGGKNYKYSFTDLGTLGGNNAVAYAINNSGQVVGEASLAGGGYHAFLWTPSGVIQDLGTLGGSTSLATGINSSGQVAGYSDNGDYVHGFFWSLGSMEDLGTIGGPNTTSSARAVNDGGLVAGQSNTTAPGISHAALWTGPDNVTDLGTLGGNQSAAYAINKSGQVAGWAQTSTSRRHAALWTGGPEDLGTLGGNNSEAHGLNNSGKAVGWSDTSTGNVLAFLWTPAQGMQMLSGSLGNSSRAYGINNSDMIVGYYSQSLGGGAFLWTPWAGMQDLNTLVIDLPSGEHLSAAYAINDPGQIVGQTSKGRAFLLTPLR